MNNTPALEYRADATRFVRDCLRIRAKDTAVVPFFGSRDFPAQIRFAELVAETRKRKEPVRIIALKARQVGLTSIATALIYQATALNPNVESRIVSSDLESVEAIHAKNQVFWDNSPKRLRPMLARSSVKEIYFNNPSRKKRAEQPGLDSRIVANTAAKATLGRSHTIHNYLGSEVAFWTEGAERSLAIMQAVPQLPGTMVILESTANGVGGFFHDKWKEASNPASGWSTFFFAWWEHPEYQRPLSAEDDLHDLTEDEVELIRLYGLSPEQINWRRHTIRDQCSGDLDKFCQEYPSSAEEAFRVSGRRAFPHEQMKAQQKNLTPGTAVKLELVGENERGFMIRAERVEPRLTGFRIFKIPVKDEVYICSMDPSKGLEDGDFQSAEVVSVRGGEEVASWMGLESPEDFAYFGFLLASFFNMAVIVPETNGEGLNTLTKLIQLRYPNIYVEEVYDSVKHRVSHRRGWYETEDKKHLCMSELKNGLKGGNLIIRSEETWTQMDNLRRDKWGRYSAPKGGNDDRVTALAKGYFVAQQEAALRRAEELAPSMDPVKMRKPLRERLRDYAVARAADETEHWST